MQVQHVNESSIVSEKNRHWALGLVPCYLSTAACMLPLYCFDASMDLLHAHLLSHPSADCMLAYMLLHRGICTFGALFCLASVQQHVPFIQACSLHFAIVRVSPLNCACLLLSHTIPE